MKILGQGKGYEVEDRFTGKKFIRSTEQLKRFKGALDIIAVPCEVKEERLIDNDYLRPRRNLRRPDRYVPG